MPENPRLSRNLIQESLFEIRFDPKESAVDYSLVIGILFERLKDKYTLSEDTGIPDFGKETPVEFSYIPKSRVFTADKKALFSLGRGVLSVNTLSYSSFEDFLTEILRVLAIHKEVSKVSKATRLVLRYINKETTTKSREEIFSISHALPVAISAKEKGFNINSRLSFGSDDVMDLRFSKNPDSNDYMLDFEYINSTSRNYDLTEIEAWIRNAHDEIHNSFKESITSEFYSELLGGDK